MDGRPDLSLAVCSYSKAQKLAGANGVIVSTSIGQPKWLPGIEQARSLAPWGLLNLPISQEEFKQRYRAALDKHADKVFAELSQIQERHPDQTLVLCCYEDVHKEGWWCHRTMAAEWLREQGYECPELTKPPPPPMPSLFDDGEFAQQARKTDPDED